MNPRPLEQQLAVITGAASGIGLACAELLAERGAKVLLLDRQIDAAQAAAQRLGGHAYEIDVADVGEVQALAERIEAEHGPVDLLISAAGIIQGAAVPPDQVPWEQYNRVFEINLRGTSAVCAAFGSRMARRGRGSIVNLASISAMRSTPLHAYGPMKAAIVALTENLAAEWGRSGVRVNCLSPGPVLTPALQAAFDQGQRDRPTMAQNAASGKISSTREVAQAAAFLLSDEASAITGVNLPVDHGWLVATSWATFGGLRPAQG